MSEDQRMHARDSDIDTRPDVEQPGENEDQAVVRRCRYRLGTARPSTWVPYVEGLALFGKRELGLHACAARGRRLACYGERRRPFGDLHGCAPRAILRAGAVSGRDVRGRGNKPLVSRGCVGGADHFRCACAASSPSDPGRPCALRRNAERREGRSVDPRSTALFEVVGECPVDRTHTYEATAGMICGWRER